MRCMRLYWAAVLSSKPDQVQHSVEGVEKELVLDGYTMPRAARPGFGDQMMTSPEVGRPMSSISSGKVQDVVGPEILRYCVMKFGHAFVVHRARWKTRVSGDGD